MSVASFTQIPDSLLVPGQYQEIDNSLAGQAGEVKKVLVVDLKSSTGTAVAGQVIPINSADQARTQLGEGSPAALAAINFLEVNKIESLYVLPLAELVAGVAAVKKITITTGVISANVLTRYIGGIKVQISIAAADTPATIAANLVAAINATKDMPAEASVSGVDALLLTSLVKGEIGNQIDVAAGLYGEADPVGVTLVVTSQTLGAGNPDVTAALAALGDIRYHYLTTTLADQANLTAFSTDLDSRYSATRQIGGRLFVVLSGLVGDAITAGTMINAAAGVNSPHVVLVPRGRNPHHPATWVARFAAYAIRRLADDPAANTQGIGIVGLVATDRYDSTTREKLLEVGIATWKIDSTGGVLIERLVTSYTENSAGSRDTSYLDVQVVETVDAVRTTINQTAFKRFQTWKLASTEENFGGGAKVMTPAIWKAFLVEMYQQVFIRDKQWCQDLATYKDSILVEVVTGSKTRLNYRHTPVLIGQFLISAGLNQFK